MSIQTLKNKLFNPSEIHISEGTVYAVLITMGVSHLLNDTIQSVIPAMYPIVKDNYGFTFAQIGLITLFFQLASSIVQPIETSSVRLQYTETRSAEQTEQYAA